MRDPRRSLWRTARVLVAVLPLLAALAGCDSQQALDAPDLTGQYVGFGGGYTWGLALTESDGALSGTGTLKIDDDVTFPVTVTGAYTYPVVGFSLNAAGFDVFTFDGRVGNEGDLLTGTVESDGGFESELSFQRQ